MGFSYEFNPIVQFSLPSNKKQYISQPRMKNSLCLKMLKRKHIKNKHYSITIFFSEALSSILSISLIRVLNSSENANNGAESSSELL